MPKHSSKASLKSLSSKCFGGKLIKIVQVWYKRGNAEEVIIVARKKLARGSRMLTSGCLKTMILMVPIYIQLKFTMTKTEPRASPTMCRMTPLRLCWWVGWVLILDINGWFILRLKSVKISLVLRLRCSFVCLFWWSKEWNT